MGTRQVRIVLVVGLLLVSAVGCRPWWIEECRRRDCSLHQASKRSQVLFGLHPQDMDADTRGIIAREAGLLVNPGFAWNVMEPERNRIDWYWADLHADFAEEERLVQFAGSFAWDGALLDDLPAWVEDITDPDELRAVLHTRARRIFTRYPDLYAINVVNEPLETFGSVPYDNHFRRVLGPDYVAELFEIVAAEAPPWTELVLNEIFVEAIPAKADALVALVTDLVTRGVPIDSVGLQTHLIFGEPDWDGFRATMDELAALGVGLVISELDVPVAPNLPDRLTVQADRYRRVVETCLAVAACDVINVWGVDDGNTWIDWFLGPGWDPLLFDSELARKPAYDAVRDALAGGREP